MTETDLDEIQIACFELGDALFAVDIMRIKEIIRPQKLAKLPKAPAFVEGMINLRGTVVPVIDLRKRFDLPERSVSEELRLLTVTVARQLVGLMVDSVTEVVTIPVASIKPPPSVVKGIGSRYLVGVCLVKDSLVMLLNLDRILTDEESSALTGL